MKLKGTAGNILLNILISLTGEESQPYKGLQPDNTAVQ